MLHFAAARTHSRNALIQLIEESGGNIAYRDELYRTPRDVAIQAGQPSNAKEIDRYIMSLAARGDLESFQNLFNDGYDHVLNITDPDNNTVIALCKTRGHTTLLDFLEGLQGMEVILLQICFLLFVCDLSFRRRDGKVGSNIDAWNYKK